MAGRVVFHFVCSDPDVPDRDAIHVETVSFALDFFTASLGIAA